ncbi:hypothetical protein ACFO1S_24425 [Cohnella boryungensis]|uniref:Uncharacterized protein n=1 Tax=Cohnella boryungensis TaxID=768479 RepID=A0ABV8SHT7_9BACL
MNNSVRNNAYMNSSLVFYSNFIVALRFFDTYALLQYEEEP